MFARRDIQVLCSLELDRLIIFNQSFDINQHQAGTVIAFYNGVAVEASEKDEGRYPDEYRLGQ